MHQRKKPATLVLILAVLLVLFMGARARQDDAPIHMDLQPDSLPYAGRGPYAAGAADFVIEGETPLEIAVWYPGSKGEEQNAEEGIKYPYEIKIGDPIGNVTVATFGGHALRQAPYDLSAAPYPLVILSPGFSIGSSAYAWLAEHFASYGFVVIAPEHSEHLDPENELWRSAIQRPQDILSVLDFVDEQVESGGSIAGLLDRDHVAVIGHSYGGYTSLAAAGARIDTASFKNHCEQAQESDHPGVWLCDQLMPHLADMALLAGHDTVPEGLWPAWADPRVDAIVTMAGDAFFFGQEGLAEIDVPVMAIGGTQDNDSPYMWSTYPSFEYVSSPRKVRIALNDAEHMIFTGPCKRITWFLKFFSDEFCADPGWDRSYAHALTKHFTAAFLLAELRQDAAAADALAPGGIRFPRVIYKAQGF